MSNKSNLRRIITIASIAVATIVAILFFTLGGFNKTQEPVSNQQPVSGQLNISVLLPSTGPAATFSTYSKQGFDWALSDIRKEYGDKLSISYEDTQTNPKVGVTLYNKVTTTEKPKVIIVLLSSVTKAIKPLLDRKSMVIASAVATPGISDPSKFLFRVFASSNEVAQKASEYILKKEKNTASVIYVNDEYGVGSMTSFKQKYESGGGKVVDVEPFSLTEKDFRTQWQKTIKNKPSALWITGYGPGYVTVLTQLREFSYEGLIVVDWTITAPEYLEATSGVKNGTVVVTPVITQEFQKLYEEKFGKAGYMVNVGYSYDAIKMIWNAYSKSDGSVESIAKNFSSINDFKGATGDIVVLPSGDITAKYQLNQLQDKKVLPLEN